MVPLSEEEIAKNRDYMNFILESEKDQLETDQYDKDPEAE